MTARVTSTYPAAQLSSLKMLPVFSQGKY